MATLEKKGNGSQPVPVSPAERFFDEGFFGGYELMLPTIATMRRAMDSLLDTMLVPDVKARFGPGPLMDVYEKDGGYVVECAVPGFKKDDVKVEVAGNSLRVMGTVADEKREEKPHYRRRELRRESFSRAIDFPQEIDPNTVAATFENGMLTIALQPLKRIEPKSIPIGSGT
jgi:HSP20 family protein